MDGVATAEGPPLRVGRRLSFCVRPLQRSIHKHTHWTQEKRLTHSTAPHPVQHTYTMHSATARCVSFIRSFVRSFGRSFVRSFVHSFIRSFSVKCAQRSVAEHRHVDTTQPHVTWLRFSNPLRLQCPQGGRLSWAVRPRVSVFFRGA